MARSDWTGPLVAFGRGRSGGGIGYSQEANGDDPAPSLFERGAGMLDNRQPFAYQPGQSVTTPFYGYPPECSLIDQVPSALAANNIAASQTPTSGTALTLVTTSGAGITVGASVVNALTGVKVTGLLAIDGAHGGVAFGTNGGFNLWDPTTAISRCVRIVSAGNDSSATFLVSGYDIYGYPLTQLVTGASGAPGTATTLKAFKYIASIMPAGTLSGSTVTVGTTDTWGLPLAASAWAYVTVYWNNTLITASTGFTAGVTTSPNTNLLGDVRGTYANQGSASNGTIALQMFWRPSVAGMLTDAGIWGVQPV